MRVYEVTVTDITIYRLNAESEQEALDAIEQSCDDHRVIFSNVDVGVTAEGDEE